MLLYPSFVVAVKFVLAEQLALEAGLGPAVPVVVLARLALEQPVLLAELVAQLVALVQRLALARPVQLVTLRSLGRQLPQYGNPSCD